jgi:hypothetical protein
MALAVHLPCRAGQPAGGCVVYEALEPRNQVTVGQKRRHWTYREFSSATWAHGPADRSSRRWQPKIGSAEAPWSFGAPR